MLQKQDPQVYDIIQRELQRQESVLELIPSENMVSPAVLEAMGSVLTNKYSEGYPRKRYYGGNEVVDEAEQLAIDRAKQLFGAEHANVQPHSGAPANLAVYFALLNIGDSAMGMALTAGGHLTHGHPVNFSGKAWKFSQYGVDEKTNLLDYDAIRKMAEKEKPKMIVSGASAYPRAIDFKELAEIAKDVGAYSMADVAHIAGLIVAGEHASPFPYTDVVTTTTHKTLRGPRSGMILCKQEFAEKIDKAIFPFLQGGPHEHIIAAKAVAFGEALKPEFKVYAKQIVLNAKALASELMARGFKLVTDGTDNHLLLVDMRSKNISGKDAETALDKAGITVNKNTIPFDPRKPWDPSGIRLGTPVLTTRGMKESEMTEVARLIDEATKHYQDDAKLAALRKEVNALCKKFPVYA